MVFKGDTLVDLLFRAMKSAGKIGNQVHSDLLSFYN